MLIPTPGAYVDMWMWGGGCTQIHMILCPHHYYANVIPGPKEQLGERSAALQEQEPEFKS